MGLGANKFRTSIYFSLDLSLKVMGLCGGNFRTAIDLGRVNAEQYLGHPHFLLGRVSWC